MENFTIVPRGKVQTMTIADAAKSLAKTLPKSAKVSVDRDKLLVTITSPKFAADFREALISRGQQPSWMTYPVVLVEAW